jgi:hypothetical protein
MPEGRKRSVTISVRCSPEQHERWRRAAEADQRTMNNAVKVAMDDWAQRVLAVQQAPDHVAQGTSPNPRPRGADAETARSPDDGR